ncbi:nucleotidyltransferase domain-containing protein [Streptomyces sp. NPDC096033]|uniref:nucleotidyltransferase domain-containing protein n=1 Tax=Streptomyces sp. NPDC096033 TaxID=3366071 RepID=UPI00381293D1
MTTPDWVPAPLSEVVELFSPLDTPWWVAGGHAIELAVGRFVRAHADIDVLVLREHQHAVQRALAGWEWWVADPPGHLRPWQPGEYLPPGAHDVWCRPGPDQPWRIQVMLDESHEDLWVSRRTTLVHRPIAELGAVTADGVPYLAPEVQLFYKAKDPRPKDEEDFAAVLPLLGPAQRNWLCEALRDAYGPPPWVAYDGGPESVADGPAHPWAVRLTRQ